MLGCSRQAGGRLWTAAALSAGLLLLGRTPRAAAAGPGDRASESAHPSRTARFHAAVLSLREQVELLAAVPPTRDERGMRRAVAALADALDRVPEARGVDVADAAAAVRGHFPEEAATATSPADPIRAAGQARSALLTAAGAMTLLARGPYRDVAELPRTVAEFEHAARLVDPAQSIFSQRPLVIAALMRGADALTALERALGIAPTPVPSVPDAGDGSRP